MPTPRETILTTYSEWTTLSALRSKAPLKKGKYLYPLLRAPRFAAVLDRSRGPIRPAEFNRWHRRTVEQLMRDEPRLRPHFGWTAKIINVYLKTFAYVGDRGRSNIRELLHPPIDGGLWKGVKRQFKDRKDILKKTHCVTSIAQINSYRRYATIISGLRIAAKELNCTLFEVEQLWAGTETK